MGSGGARGDPGRVLGKASAPEGGRELQWAALGGGGVTDPKGVEGTFRYSEGRGSVGRERWEVGRDDMGVFSNLCDSKKHPGWLSLS